MAQTDSKKEERKWQLPLGVASITDISRLQRELDKLDLYLRQNKIMRSSGEPTQIPKASHVFIEIVSDNKLNMLKEPDRGELANFLEALRQSAPLIHVSFNSEPSPLFLQKLISWLRQHIHHYVILQIGLMPNIGAGCIVRTENKYFDFSLRQRFDNQKTLLAKQFSLNETVPQEQQSQAGAGSKI